MRVYIILFFFLIRRARAVRERPSDAFSVGIRSFAFVGRKSGLERSTRRPPRVRAYRSTCRDTPAPAPALAPGADRIRDATPAGPKALHAPRAALGSLPIADLSLLLICHSTAGLVSGAARFAAPRAALAKLEGDEFARLDRKGDSHRVGAARKRNGEHLTRRDANHVLREHAHLARNGRVHRGDGESRMRGRQRGRQVDCRRYRQRS